MVAADQSSCCRVKFEAGAGVGVRKGFGKEIVRGRMTRGVVDLKARLGVLLEDILLESIVDHSPASNNSLDRATVATSTEGRQCNSRDDRRPRNGDRRDA